MRPTSASLQGLKIAHPITPVCSLVARLQDPFALGLMSLISIFRSIYGDVQRFSRISW